MHMRQDSLRWRRVKGPLPDVRTSRPNARPSRFGEKHGTVSADWCFDVYTAMEQVCEEVNLITQWVDSLDTLDEITEANFLVWVRTKGQNVLDMQWPLKQLYCVLTQKLTGQVKEFTQSEMGKGIIRGATTWHTPRRQTRTTILPSCCQLEKRKFVSWKSSLNPH